MLLNITLLNETDFNIIYLHSIKKKKKKLNL